jgi:hypothetical protein
MLILDGTLFFHINSKEFTMLSSKPIVPDLFSSSMYALLTEKIPAGDGVHSAYPPHSATVEMGSAGSASPALKLLQHPSLIEGTGDEMFL